MQAQIHSLFPVAKTLLVGVATTAEVIANPDWRIVAVNGLVSLGFALITHFAARSGRYKSRPYKGRKPRVHSDASHNQTK